METGEFLYVLYKDLLYVTQNLKSIIIAKLIT